MNNTTTTTTADDEATLLTAWRACDPDDRRRIIEHARTCAGLAGQPRQSIAELLALAEGDPVRRRIREARLAGNPATIAAVAPRWCVVRDEDGHSYLVPAERRAEAVAAIEACGRYWDPDTTVAYRDAHEGEAELPAWVRRVAGVAALTFAAPREDA